ncbi:MAG TPA: response regulator transcription factor [Bacteroidales bacterium]|nr:response regulator transcription factor [Bacteroidales bacterium]
MRTLKIVLVDDNEPFRKALKTLLVKEFNANIIGEASSAEEFSKLTGFYNANIILMDVMMPEVDGITLAKKILWKFPHLKIIAITMHTDKVYLTSLIEAGFKGCIFKTNIFEDLNSAIDTVINGHLYFPKDIIIS